uniref:Uncharacterized protein n=1 Tax=Phlebotomus papatasi TaxID=29031 RepID=A0A1B0DCF3_PHLPP
MQGNCIIRILAPPEEDVELRNARKFKKKEAWDTRSRRSSLPTLYEYDSDGGSSVRTISQDPSQAISMQLQQHRSRRTSRSSSTYRSDNVDMRSMSEVTVDFGRPDNLDSTSDASSHYPNRYYEDDPYDRRSLQRSLSQPSLARSASEFTERWVAPDTGSDLSSPDQTPKVRRSTRFIFNDVLPASVVEAPLKGIQILLIICAIMFLTLLLLGLGVSYYCLRRRPVTVVRRLPMSMGSGSEITKLSGSSLGNISAFEGLKIPRAHAPLAAVHSSSGSDGPLISDTIPSDYPSESHSEIEEVDTRSLPVSSTGSFENRAFVQDNSSIYSEHYGHTQEFQAANAVAQASMVPRLPLAVKESSPKFDVQVRVKRAAPPPPASLSSDTDSVANSRTERNNLSTIMESHEDRDSILTIDSMPQDVAHSQFTYVPELHPAPRHIQAPPVFSRIVRKQQEVIQRQERQPWPEDLVDAPPSIPDTRSIASLGTEMTDTHSIGEMMDSSHLYPISSYRSSVQLENTEAMPEPPIHVMRKPEITSHVVDDVFLRTITEKKTIEDIEQYKRKVTEYATAKPIPPPDPTWDVTIRKYSTDEGPQPQWEDFSDRSSSVSGVPLTPQMERVPLVNVPPMPYLDESGEKLYSPELVGNMKPIELPPEDKTVPNWDVLIRILEPEITEVDDRTSTESPVSFLTRQLSYEDKTKWKEIITTESTLRTMLKEAVVKEDFERIRSDSRYEKLFEPQSWDMGY